MQLSDRLLVYSVIIVVLNAFSIYYLFSQNVEVSSDSSNQPLIYKLIERQVPLDIKTGLLGQKLLIVDVTLHDKSEYHFLIDQLAPYSVIDSHIVDKYNLETQLYARRATTPVGQSKANYTVIDGWHIKGTPLPNTKVLALDVNFPDAPEIHGMIGNDVLNKFIENQIDYNNSVLKLKLYLN